MDLLLVAPSICQARDLLSDVLRSLLIGQFAYVLLL